VEQPLLVALVVLSPVALFACLGMRRMAMFWDAPIDFTECYLRFNSPAFVTTISPGTSTI
jgi:hypothetical protein